LLLRSAEGKPCFTSISQDYGGSCLFGGLAGEEEREGGEEEGVPGPWRRRAGLVEGEGCKDWFPKPLSLGQARPVEHRQ